MSDPKPFTPPIFVVNLERSTDRRQNIADQLVRIGIDFEFFPATDGEKLTKHEFAQYDEQFVIKQISRPMSRPEVGCYLSHVRLWKKIVDEDIPWAVILEDDVDILGDVDGILAAIDTLPFKWDLIRLAGLGPNPALPLCTLPGDATLSTLLLGASGTQAYCISCRGATKLLRRATPRVVGTIDDHVLDNVWKTGIRILAVQPYPVSENSKFVSSIETERRRIFQEHRKKPETLTFQRWAIRRRYKIGRSIDRRMYAIVHALFWLKQTALCAFSHRGNKYCSTVTADANTVNNA